MPDRKPLLEIDFVKQLPRQCGGCTLCCKLLPVRELDKGAGERCRHQVTGKGCRVYGSARMPPSCRLWSCAWLTGADVGSRPDRAHYVVDIMPDYVTVVDNATGDRRPLQVVQVWIDPKFPDAHRDPALRAYLAERGKEGVAAIIRYNNRSAFTLMPPALASDDEWHEVHSNLDPEKTHSLDDVIATLSGREKPDADRA